LEKLKLSDVNHKNGVNTIREILSEPQTWKACLSDLQIGEYASFLKNPSLKGEQVFVGCGSSYYLAQVAAMTWSLLTKESVRALPASEILLFPELLKLPCKPVLISRSGYTTEMIEVGKFFQERKIPALGISCGAATPIEKVSTKTIVLRSADEKSTVMTRSFTSMLLALQWLAAEYSKQSSFVTGLKSLADQLDPKMTEIQSTVESLVNDHQFADYVFLGQGPFFGVAQEAMLKVKEMSCSYAQAFHTLEFRHGPKAIVSPETLVTFFISESGFSEEVPVLQEIKELGAITLVVANSSTPAMRKAADYLIELNFKAPEPAMPAPMVVPGQFLGYFTAMQKGFDPDSPRNLTRVVMLDGIR
jgi:glucosamine--fructose-6-phosphate aminotransferase (isomerizing)